jgi:NAD(P)-dependent dehydrogenase (short-subunit alcohol dehydrogenase family)
MPKPCYAPRQVSPDVWVAGVDCDVASPSSVQRLAEAAAAQLGAIDVWINNAGYSGSFQARARGVCRASHGPSPARFGHALRY